MFDVNWLKCVTYTIASGTDRSAQYAESLYHEFDDTIAHPFAVPSSSTSHDSQDEQLTYNPRRNSRAHSATTINCAPP